MRCGLNNDPGRRPRRFRSRAGFTFAEVLAAMVFLGVLIPVVIEGLTLANRGALVTERKSVATRLAANVLNEFVVTRSWNSGQSRGEFGSDWPGYSWELQTSLWSEDAMTELTVIVRYPVQGRDYEARLSTLVDDSTTTAATGGASSSGP